MAIDVRGLVDYDLASHFYDITTNKGKFNYFIDSKAQWQFKNEPNPVKMTSQDLAYTQSVIDGIGQMTGLKSKKTTNVNKSTFVIQKTNDFKNGLLGYMRPTSWGNYLVFDDYFNTKQLNSLSRSTVDHEIAHAIGIGHPYGSGPNPNYTNIDTVMSYNRNQYKDGNLMYYGYTPSDENAISYWWGNTNNAYQPDGKDKIPEKLPSNQNTITIDPHGGDDHNHKTLTSLEEASPTNTPKQNDTNTSNPAQIPDGLPEITISQERFTLTSRNLRKHTGDNSIKGPFAINLDSSDNTFKGEKWDENISDLTDFGRISLRGLGGNDTLYLNGKTINSHGASLSFSGGEDKDKVIINESDDIIGSAGLLFGFNANNKNIPRVIRLTLPDEVTVKVGIEGGSKKHTFNPEILIRDDVEIIKIDGQKFKFDDLFDALDGSDGILLTDL